MQDGAEVKAEGNICRSDGEALAEAVAIMARLRGPGGCPWDREQTFDTIKPHTLEETYEVFDAIERRDWPDLKDELGDLLLQVLFYAQMAADAGYFDIGDVAADLNAKLIRRHPHIFGDVEARDAGRGAARTGSRSSGGEEGEAGGMCRCWTMFRGRCRRRWKRTSWDRRRRRWGSTGRMLRGFLRSWMRRLRS